MTAQTWLALGLGLLLLPFGSPLAVRTRALAEGGRLAGPAGGPRAVTDTGTLGRGRSSAARAAGLAGGAVGIATVGVVLLAAGPALAAACAVAVATAARLIALALRARAARRHDAELLSALRLMAAELDAGGRPAAACAAAAEACPGHGPELSAAAAACSRGDDPGFASAPLAGLGHAWRLAAVSGAPLADVIRRLADDLAARIEQQRAVGAALAGARPSAAMLAGLPVLGLLLGAAMQARPLEVLVGTPAGRALCLVGVLLDAAGLLWTQLLAARAERP